MNSVSIRFLNNNFAVHNQDYSNIDFLTTFHLHTIRETLIIKNNKMIDEDILTLETILQKTLIAWNKLNNQRYYSETYAS